MSKKILVPIANGTEEIEAVCIIDELRRAESSVIVASVDKLQVTAKDPEFNEKYNHIEALMKELQALKKGGVPGMGYAGGLLNR